MFHRLPKALVIVLVNLVVWGGSYAFLRWTPLGREVAILYMAQLGLPPEVMRFLFPDRGGPRDGDLDKARDKAKGDSRLVPDEAPKLADVHAAVAAPWTALRATADPDGTELTVLFRGEALPVVAASPTQGDFLAVYAAGKRGYVARAAAEFFASRAEYLSFARQTATPGAPSAAACLAAARRAGAARDGAALAALVYRELVVDFVVSGVRRTLKPDDLTHLGAAHVLERFTASRALTLGDLCRRIGGTPGFFAAELDAFARTNVSVYWPRLTAGTRLELAQVGTRWFVKRVLLVDPEFFP